MGIFGFIKDVALLPVEAALDVTGIGMMDAIANDKDQPFRTIGRIESALKNLDETLD